MRMLLGLDRPQTGTATIAGRRYRDLVEPLRVGALLEARAVHTGRLPQPARHGPDAGHPAHEGRRGDRPVWLHDVAGKRPGGFPLGMP
jgi:ABC-2 type transport system ATP-binding protein